MALGHWAKTYLNPNGGGTELPSVTASDNGKVLGVDGGEYKLVEQSGGDSLIEEEFVTLDKGYARLIVAGQNVRLILKGGSFASGVSETENIIIAPYYQPERSDWSHEKSIRGNLYFYTRQAQEGEFIPFVGYLSQTGAYTFKVVMDSDCPVAVPTVSHGIYGELSWTCDPTREE